MLHKKQMLQVLNVQIKLNCFLKHHRVDRGMVYIQCNACLGQELASVTVRGFGSCLCLFVEVIPKAPFIVSWV